MGDDRHYFRVVLGKLADCLYEFKQRCFLLSFHCITSHTVEYLSNRYAKLGMEIVFSQVSVDAQKIIFIA
jgi:hypothetical protein